MVLFKANRFIASLAITALTVTSGLTPGAAMASDAQVKSMYNVQSAQSSINTLTRLGGYDRYGTAVQIADHGWQSASTAVLAPSGDRNMVDALASSSLAKAVDGPILLADIDSVPASTLNELKKLGVTKVYLVSGTAVMSAKVESQLTAAGIQSVRLGGYDRYETAVNIAKEIQKIKPFQEVVVTNAFANVDAISIAPIAAAKGIPVLLVDKDSVSKVVSDFIKSSGINKTYVIGGTAVVSNLVKDALPNALRLGGNDRFDTNTEVLKQFENLIVGGSMFFANGNDTSLIDSLTGAPMAAKLGGAIVLSNKEAVPVGTKAFIQTDIALKNPGILGGTAVMSDSTVQSLGYAQPGQSAILNGAVELNTPNAAFKDLTVNGNILVDADGVTLQNVIVKGTVFVDPGKAGSTTLDGVQATRIVVLSGADHSIHLKNTKADRLVVSSSSPGTRVVAEAGTTLGFTLVQSNGTVESQSGANVGVLSAQPRLDTQIAVGLQGTFANDVALSGSLKLTAEAGAVVSNVKVAKAASSEAIQLAGQFASVSITDSSSVTVVSGTVAKMNTAAASSIVVKPGAAVTSLSSSAGSVTLSGGGSVNGNLTTATPTSSTIPVTPVTPSDGGGGGSSTSTVAVSAITNADVAISSGSIIFGYTFTAASDAVTYAQAKAAPYYLDAAASTVTIKDGAGNSAVSYVQDLGIADDGTISYANLAAVQSKFAGLNFLPTAIQLHLVGASVVNSGANAWTKDVTVTLEAGEIALLTPAQANGSDFTPGVGGALPTFVPFASENNKIGGLYVDRNHKYVTMILSGNPIIDHIVEMKFLPPQDFGATGYTLQYSSDNGVGWANYSNVATESATQDNFSIKNPGGDYQYRLLVVGGNSAGYTSNIIEAPSPSVVTRFTGYGLDESMVISGVMAPFIGRGLTASFTATQYVSDADDLVYTDRYMTYQWFRVNPVTYEMTVIPGATNLTYVTTAADAGYHFIVRATGDGEKVGGYLQILAGRDNVVPNKAFISNVTNTGFTLNLHKTVSSLAVGDLILRDKDNAIVPIISVTAGANNAVFNILANINQENGPFRLQNNSGFWQIVSVVAGGHMMTEGVEVAAHSASSAKDITIFSFADLAPSEINGTNISLTVPKQTDVTALKATFVSSPGSTVTVGSTTQISGTTANDFTNPVTYTVTARDSTTKTYTVTVTIAPIAAKAITAFVLVGLNPAVVGVINEASHTIAVAVPSGTAVSALATSIAITGASVSPNTGTVQDFTSPVTYTVTATDGSTQNYVVTVTVLSA
ncbi:cell wall-binding repeat-containing protein [Desulfosporosinus sp. BICA1-9]|uniref:cell wall-binding repeat-containing protein n=1 Tax=Desulfosporosinus sp. BICA1-9 TaxID=1531958 RepID=UPI000A9E773A|nr:cell wall-binding repeat-containing protein [Desulfosporosinus sp. BICA1-9]